MGTRCDSLCWPSWTEEWVDSKTGWAWGDLRATTGGGPFRGSSIQRCSSRPTRQNSTPSSSPPPTGRTPQQNTPTATSARPQKTLDLARPRLLGERLWNDVYNRLQWASGAMGEQTWTSSDKHYAASLSESTKLKLCCKCSLWNSCWGLTPFMNLDSLSLRQVLKTCWKERRQEATVLWPQGARRRKDQTQALLARPNLRKLLWSCSATSWTLQKLIRVGFGDSVVEVGTYLFDPAVKELGCKGLSMADGGNWRQWTNDSCRIQPQCRACYSVGSTCGLRWCNRGGRMRSRTRGESVGGPHDQPRLSWVEARRSQWATGTGFADRVSPREHKCSCGCTLLLPDLTDARGVWSVWEPCCSSYSSSTWWTILERGGKWWLHTSSTPATG